MTLESGQEFTAEIDGVWRGKGTVEKNHTTINIGPVRCDAGEPVRLRYLGQKEEMGNDVGFAVCLTEEVLADGYREYIGNIIDELIPDRPPNTGEIRYAEIDHITDRNLAVTELGGYSVQLGPVTADEGDIVRIRGVSNTAARIETKSAQADHYHRRFEILTDQYDSLPITKGEEITTTIVDIYNESPLAYIFSDIPVLFKGSDINVAQKVDATITGFEQDYAVGEVTETYDEVGRIKEPGHWARMQWLRESGFVGDPFKTFARAFLNVETLPSTDDQIREALIAEAIRLATVHGSHDESSNQSTSRIHISALRHWVTHKLSAILGEPEDDDDWFRSILDDRKGPTMVFTGDILELAGGYYAPGPSRVVVSKTHSEAVLVSGYPTRFFIDNGFDIEFRGISRILTNVSSTDLDKANIPTQSPTQYVGADQFTIASAEDLTQLLEIQQHENAIPTNQWEAYPGHQGQFSHDADPLTVTTEHNQQLSFWREPIEYGADQYWLYLEDQTGTNETIHVPRRHKRNVMLTLDAMGGVPRVAEFSPGDQAAILSTDFVPPRQQMRWLHAIGAQWLETPENRLQWQIGVETQDTVQELFDELPIKLRDSLTQES